MSEIEKAIKYLLFLKAENNTPSIDIKLTTAIQALQEKLECDNGCKYCAGDVDNREELLSTDDGCVYIDGNNNLTYQDHSGFTIDNEIHVCPICGRKLVE